MVATRCARLAPFLRSRGQWWGPGDPLRPAGAVLAIATGLDGGDPLRPAGAVLAIATGLDGGDPLRPAGAVLAIARGADNNGDAPWTLNATT
jgi:hypothetical protein